MENTRYKCKSKKLNWAGQVWNQEKGKNAQMADRTYKNWSNNLRE